MIVKPGKKAILISFILLNLNVYALTNSLNRIGETYYVTEIPQKNQIIISADSENANIKIAVDEIKSALTNKGIGIQHGKSNYAELNPDGFSIKTILKI